MRSILPAVLGLIALTVPATAQGPVATPITVYKTPTCGCCSKWVDHMRANGFAPKVEDLPNLAAVKMSTGVPRQLQSCHTSVVEGYAVEGHVPADVVRQMLKEKPKIVGIAVPGMPMGSPGMEGSYTEKYNVVAFDKDGGQRVYASR
jgi:hypothetical protein